MLANLRLESLKLIFCHQLVQRPMASIVLCCESCPKILRVWKSLGGGGPSRLQIWAAVVWARSGVGVQMIVQSYAEIYKSGYGGKHMSNVCAMHIVSSQLMKFQFSLSSWANSSPLFSSCTSIIHIYLRRQYRITKIQGFHTPRSA